MDKRLDERTSQDLLAERRDNIQELRREHDSVARSILMAHVAMIDAILAKRRKGVTCTK